MDSSELVPRVLAIYWPLKLKILNWQGDEEQWLDGPSALTGQPRRIPWGREVLVEKRDFAGAALVAGDGVGSQLGTAVRLRHSYVVSCESVEKDEAGNVVEIHGRCNYDSLGVPTALDGVGEGPKVVSWVHASLDKHLQVPLVEGPGNFVATYWPPGAGNAEAVPEFSMLCEPWLRSLASVNGYENLGQAAVDTGVQLERLGRFRVCSLPERRIALQCLSAWRPKFCTPAKPSKRQRVPDAVLAAAAAEAAARKEAMQKASVDFARFALEEPLLMVCACDRWERVLALDLQEAWQSTDFVNVSVEEIAPALFRIRGPVPPMPATPNQAPATEDQKEKIQILPEGTFDRECVWHAAGIRRCLQLLTLPLKPAEVIEAAAKLNFPDGWSLEHEGPHPVRYESLAPFTQSSSFLAAGLGRVISGPIRPSPDETDRHASARLVTVEMINSEGLHFLAKDSLGRQSFNPTAFGSIWRSRPFPDYSAALEPLAALALLGIGLRVHHRLGREPRAFLDATCGTGTVAAAAKYCVSAWPIFAGDVNVTMSKRSLANLAAAFPGQAYELLDEPPPTDPLPGIGVRHWDATNPWPIPARAGLGEGGEGLLVASNLPWGKSLDTQVEAATQVARTLSATLPRATMCLIAPEEVGRNCSDWFKLLHTAPVGKKAKDPMTQLKARTAEREKAAKELSGGEMAEDPSKVIFLDVDGVSASHFRALLEDLLKLRHREAATSNGDASSSSGYLGAGPHARYFYSLVKSRHASPLILWMTGGPGCSSILAMLSENGPCRPKEKFKNEQGHDEWKLEHNPFSWTEAASVLWVDQPAQVGFSTGEPVYDEKGVSQRMLAFMQNFYGVYPELLRAPLYITGESFAGHFIPAVATALLEAFDAGNPVARLHGVAMGNAWVSPASQYGSKPWMAFTGGFPEGGSVHGIVNESVFHSMLGALPSCLRGVRSCQAETWIPGQCLSAFNSCTTLELIPEVSSGRNPYDLRKVCTESSAINCYDFTLEKEYLNDVEVKRALGVSEQLKWKVCNLVIDVDFAISGDWLSDSSHVVDRLLDRGVPVLAYSGDTDLMVDWLGTKNWMAGLSWSKAHHWAEAAEAAEQPLRTGPNSSVAGRVRSAGGLTFVQIFNAGHMVPRDQPEAALAMVREFISPSSKWRQFLPAETLAREDVSWMLPALVSIISLVVLGVAILRVARRTGSDDSYVLLS
ncbi:Carboxypeptidase Y homolog A [Durusdinium trenchii]|uniref:Carboxypeptidase Y homolog A n=1 Tax=Durusdinium trenchii TaxID=1381693 RepID=A0ABP0QXW1_9DINO